MYFAYVVNIIVFFILSLFPPFFYQKQFKINFLNPIMLQTGINIGLDIFRVFLGPIVLCYEGLFNPFYQHALLITNIYNFFSCIMIIWLYQFVSHNHFLNNVFDRFKIKRKIAVVKKSSVNICVILLVLLSIIAFFLLANHTFSVLEWIKKPRLGYQFHRTGAGAFYALYLFFLSSAFSLFLIYYKENLKYYVLIIIFYFLVYLLGSKGQFLYFFISLYTILWFRGKKQLGKIIILCLPLVIILMLINFGSKDISAILRYFDYYYNSALFFEKYDNGEISLYMGKLQLTNLWALVPRSLYPNKPYVYGILHINEIFYPGQAELTNTPAFGGPIMQFADYGYFGVILSAIFDVSKILHVFGYYLLFKRYSFNDIKNNPMLLLVFLYMFAPSFLLFFRFPLNIFLIICLLFMLSFFFIVKIQTKYLKYQL